MLTPSVIEPVTDEPMEGVTPVNVDNLSTTRQPAGMAEEPTIFMSCFVLDTMLQKEKERASVSFFSLDLKATLPFEVAAKPYPSKYKVPKFQKYNGWKGNKKDHIVRFLD